MCPSERFDSEIRHLTSRRWAATLLGLAVLLVATLVVGAFLGSEPISLLDQIRSARTGGWESIHPVFREVRFPRLILAALVGGALSLSGAVYQAVLRNPLAEPYLLGISSGASAGAVLPGFLGIAAAFWAGPLFAFGGAILALALLLGLTRLQGGLRTFNLILTGVILASFFSAGILLAISVSEALAAKGIILRIVGRLSAPTWRLPYPVALAAGALDTLLSALTRRPPRIPLDGVRMARKPMRYRSTRASQVLGWSAGPVDIALQDAVRWFVERGYAPAPPNFKRAVSGLPERISQTGAETRGASLR